MFICLELSTMMLASDCFQHEVSSVCRCFWVRIVNDSIVRLNAECAFHRCAVWRSTKAVQMWVRSDSVIDPSGRIARFEIGRKWRLAVGSEAKKGALTATHVEHVTESTRGG